MTDTLEQVSALLHEAGETHHRVFRIVDGADDEWASWYAWWLINLSELPDLLDAKPLRSELKTAPPNTPMSWPYLTARAGTSQGLRVRMPAGSVAAQAAISGSI
jgi:hypothetical protein